VSSRYVSVLLRTFFRVFFSHYRYFIPFWLALSVFLVVVPLIVVFGRALTEPGNQIESVKHVIASLMGPLLAVYDPIMIAVFSAAIVVAMAFDEVRWGVVEHTLCTAPVGVGRLVLLKSLVSVLLVVPMALCVVAARTAFVYLFMGSRYLGYVAPLHVVLLLANSFTATLALATVYNLLILLTPSKYGTALNALSGIIPIILMNTVALRALQEPASITAGDLYTYTAAFAAVCVVSVALGYVAAEKMGDRIALNVIAP